MCKHLFTFAPAVRLVLSYFYRFCGFYSPLFHFYEGIAEGELPSADAIGHHFSRGIVARTKCVKM